MILAGSDPGRIDIIHHLADSPTVFGFDLSNVGITKHVIFMWIASAVLIIVLNFAARQRGLVPHGFRNFLEPILLYLRDEVAKALEIARDEKRIGSSLAAKVRIEAPENTRVFLESFGTDLRFLFITSGVEFGAGGDGAFRSERIPGLSVEVLRADGSKCERCWNYTTDVGTDPDYAGICARCSEAVREILSQEGRS